MIWVELLLHVPGYVGHQARAALAKKQEESGKHLPSAFFHYNEDGPVPDSPPPIRILADGRKVRLLGIGEKGAELLLSNARRVAELLRLPGAGGARFSISEGEFEAEWMASARRQVLSSYVIQAPTAIRELLKTGHLEQAELLEVVQRSVESALMRQIAWLAPGASVPPITGLSVKQSVGVHVHGPRFLTALNLEFHAPVRFVGPWQLGRLQARGYGRMRTPAGRAKQ